MEFVLSISSKAQVILVSDSARAGASNNFKFGKFCVLSVSAVDVIYTFLFDKIVLSIAEILGDVVNCRH